MRRRPSSDFTWLFPVLAVLVVPSVALSQTDAGPRRLAPGVLRVLQPQLEIDETKTGPEAIVELTSQKGLDWQPHFAPKTQTAFDRAQHAILRREVWGFEFAFKPLRVTMVDIPQPSGKLQRKPVWYMVYRVRYKGGNIAPTPQPDGTVKPVVTQHEDGRPFLPQFLLTAHELGKTYMDQAIPAAMETIRAREKPDGPLLDSVTITTKPIPFADADDAAGVWGVAMWQDVDPRIDFLTVDIKGLTNAYRPIDPPGAYKEGDPAGTGRQLLTKTLRLHFWKPGDTVDETDDVVQFGVPVEEDPVRQQEILQIYKVKRRVDYEWVYR